MFGTIEGNHLKAIPGVSGSLDLTTGPSNPRNNVGPPDLRRTRHSAQGHHDRGQRQRRYPDSRPGRRHPARRGSPRPTSPTPRSPARGQGLRLQPQPRRTAQAPDPARHLPQGITEHQGLGQAPLRRRADLRPAPPLQTTRCALGTPHRTPRRLHLTRLQPHLPPAPQEGPIMIVLRALCMRFSVVPVSSTAMSFCDRHRTSRSGGPAAHKRRATDREHGTPRKGLSCEEEFGRPRLAPCLRPLF